MLNFCSLFDSNYLSRGLALYDSLERHCPAFHLFVIPFDDVSCDILQRLQLPHATVIPLKEFEDESLLRVKPTRTNAEYCWTCTSSTILYVLEKYNVDLCTYVDADVYFFSSPAVLIDELAKDSILITEHRYTPRYDKSKKSGKYCVQFTSFRNDERGLRALRWWRERCLEWCYARVENGKFGDQMYLDDWTERFQGVHVLRHLGGGLAPWNVQQYEMFQNNGKLLGRELKSQKEFEAVFYHFHYVHFYQNGLLDLGRRILSKEVIELAYKPYLRHLDVIAKKIASRGPGFDPNGSKPYRRNWKTPILYAYRNLAGVYNVFEKHLLVGE